MLWDLAKRCWHILPPGKRDKIRKRIQNVKFNIRFLVQADKYINRFDLDNPPLFETIEIETVNRCNGACSFCPVNSNEKQRPYAKMTDALFKKIIRELSKIKYSGDIALFSNNEPLLDERIVEFYKYTREMLPGAFIHICTNGSLLTLERFLQLITYLDRMIIDNYNDNRILNENIKPIYEYCSKHMEIMSKVCFSMRLQNEILTSRGGMAPNKKMGGGSGR